MKLKRGARRDCKAARVGSVLVQLEGAFADIHAAAVAEGDTKLDCTRLTAHDQRARIGETAGGPTGIAHMGSTCGCKIKGDAARRRVFNVRPVLKIKIHPRDLPGGRPAVGQRPPVQINPSADGRGAAGGKCAAAGQGAVTAPGKVAAHRYVPAAPQAAVGKCQ